MIKDHVGLTEQQLDSYMENGFVLVRGALATDEARRLRQRAEDIAARRVQIPEGPVVDGRATGVSRRKPAAMGQTMMGPASATAAEPEIRITEHHARRGYQIYPIRQ